MNHRRQGTLNRPFVSFPPQLRQQAADLNSPPTSNESKVYSLSQVARSIRLALERATANKSWLVRAEIVSISGNLGERTVYLDLVEESEGRQNAKMRGIIWAANGKRILEELGPEAGQVLQAGSEVVFSARIQFHERYGVSLHIDKIELRFMLGELERRKQATIERLKKEGVLDLNRRIPVPFLPQKVALVGSHGTSGFRDFITKSLGHSRRNRIQIEAFQSSVQGLTAAEELVRAIDQATASRPDLIVLVRGGGGKLDLDAFNDLEVCLAISRSSVPVWTGIGHESDLVVADLVANRAWKTPTDVAVGLTDRFEEAEYQLDEMLQQLNQRVTHWVSERRQELSAHSKVIRWSGKHVISQRQTELSAIANHLRNLGPSILGRKQNELREWQRRCMQSSQFKLEQSRRELSHFQHRMARSSLQQLAAHRTLLAHFQRTLRTIGPDQTLQRGFMLLEREGKVLSRVAGISSGEQLQIRAHDGQLNVTVDDATSSASDT